MLTDVTSNFMTVQNLQMMDRGEARLFIIGRLNTKYAVCHKQSNSLADECENYVHFERLKCETKVGVKTVNNINLLNRFADLGIYEYTNYLFLDFYRGAPILYLQYWNGDHYVYDDMASLDTADIIYRIFELTIFSGKRKKR